MYLRAFSFYVGKLKAEGPNCCYNGIVFCENSGVDLKDFTCLAGEDKRIELISAPPDAFPAFLGKNNDFNLMDYAIDRSILLSDQECAFFKLTGRYYIKNITELFNDVARGGRDLDFYCDIRDYTFYYWFAKKFHMEDAEARYFYVTRSFWMDNFYQCYKNVSHDIPVERFLLNVSRANLKNQKCRFRFLREAYIGGDQFTSQNAPSVQCWGVRMSPEIYFGLRSIRWRIETFLRHIVPWFWF